MRERFWVKNFYISDLYVLQTDAIVFAFVWIFKFFLNLKGSCKKVVFLVARPLRPYPTPLKLSGHIFYDNFFRASKNFFFLSCQALTPLPLSRRATIFFAASLNNFSNWMYLCKGYTQQSTVCQGLWIKKKTDPDNWRIRRRIHIHAHW